MTTRERKKSSERPARRKQTERLAAALRANLQRRKAQARARRSAAKAANGKET